MSQKDNRRNGSSASTGSPSGLDARSSKAHFSNYSMYSHENDSNSDSEIPLCLAASNHLATDILEEKSLIDMGFKPFQGLVEMHKPPKDNLYELLRNMLQNNIKPDVTIKIANSKFQCHKLVLKTYSTLFKDFTNEESVYLPVDQVTPDAFAKVYEWMLADEPQIQREGLLDLYNAAKFLQIDDLVEQCWACFNDEVYCCEDNAFFVYIESRPYEMEVLQQIMLTRISKFFLTLVASQDFLEFNIEELSTLLSSSNIGVNSEFEVLMAVARWLDYNWEARKKDMLKAVQCVRFSLMPAWCLVLFQKGVESDEVARITEDPEVKRMIRDALNYSTTHKLIANVPDALADLIGELNITPPIQRQWVYDKNCSYHHRGKSPATRKLTYEKFVEYLKMLENKGKDYWRGLEVYSADI